MSNKIASFARVGTHPGAASSLLDHDEFAISQVAPDEGKYLVAKAKFSAWHPEQRL